MEIMQLSEKIPPNQMLIINQTKSGGQKQTNKNKKKGKAKSAEKQKIETKKERKQAFSANKQQHQPRTTQQQHVTRIIIYYDVGMNV